MIELVLLSSPMTAKPNWPMTAKSGWLPNASLI